MTAPRRHAFGARRVVAIHGFTGSGADWEDLAGRLRADVLAPDLPGHAGAPPPAIGFDETVDGIVETARASGWDGADWIGYSMGGRIALAAALAGPETARSLVLVGATPGIEDHAERAARHEEEEGWARAIEEGGVDRFIEAWDARPLFARRHRTVHPRHETTGLAAAVRCLGRGTQRSLHDDLVALRCPALFVAGALDPTHVATALEMARLAPLGASWIAPGAGHAVHAEAPEALAARIEEFWRGLP